MYTLNNTDHNNPNQLISLKEALEILSISDTTLRRYMAKYPDFPQIIKLTPTARRSHFRKADIEKWIESRSTVKTKEVPTFPNY